MTEKVIKDSRLDNYLSTIPPQNIEAEEAILGGIMLDEGAMERVVEILTPEAFYASAHQEIYRAAKHLYEKDKNPDFMAVTDYLVSHKVLEKVGGQSKIAQLLHSTVSAVNIDRYAELVMEKYQRRLLIQSGNEIAHVAGDSLNTTEAAIEIARNKLESLLALPDKKGEQKYNKLIQEAEKIILYEDNPGRRAWDLHLLGKKHGINASKVEEIYYKHLLHKDSSPAMTWEELIKHESDSPEWVYYGFMLRGALTLLYSDPGVGKTLFFYFLAFCAAAGISWKTKIGEFSATAKRRKILFVQCDETKPEMIRSLRRLGFDGQLDCTYLTDWNVNEMPKLIREIQLFRPDAIIIDSLASVGDWTIEENNTKFAVPVLLLRRLAGIFSCWIGLTHHANANGGLRGTTAIGGAASTVIKMERIQGQPLSSSQRKLIFQKNRAGRPWTALTRVDYESGQWEILEEEGGGGDILQLQGLRDKIYTFLAKHAPTRYETKELSEHLEHGQPSIRRGCNQLAATGLISKVQLAGKCLYFVQRDPSDPTDPSDPDAIQPLGSHSNSHYITDTANSDPPIAQNQNLENQVENEKIEDRWIADAETTQNQELECDPPSRIAPGSQDRIAGSDRINAEDCRGLTIKQPHAQRFLQGLKRYEVRGKKTNYRGTVLIHSSKEYEKGFNMDRTLASVEYPAGRILAVAELVDCIEITEAFMNEQPEDELFGGYWQPGRWAWKLENIRPVSPLPSAAGNFMLWKPAIDHLDGCEIGDRVDKPNDERWTCVHQLVSEIDKYPDLRHDLLEMYQGLMSDRQWAEALRRLPPVTDESVTDESVTDESVTDESVTDESVTDESVTDESVTDEPMTISIFDQVQVGDRLIRNGSTFVCIKKSLSPKEIQIRTFDGSARVLMSSELEIMNFQLSPLKPGMTVRLGEFWGELSQRCKNGKWFIRWQSTSDAWTKKHGEPPKNSIAPELFEVIDA